MKTSHFPTKIPSAASEYDPRAMRETKKQVVGKRIELTVEKVDLAAGHDAVFFRDVAIPADLPVFTVKDRALVGSAFPEPIGGDRETTRLAEVVARVAAQEEKEHPRQALQNRAISARSLIHRWRGPTGAVGTRKRGTGMPGLRPSGATI
jgi:hypothetical protein